MKKVLSLSEARRLTPPVDPTEAIRRSLHRKLFESISEADVAAMVDAIKAKALAGDVTAQRMLIALVTSAPPPRPVAVEKVVLANDDKRRDEVMPLPAMAVPRETAKDARRQRTRRLAEDLASMGGSAVMRQLKDWTEDAIISMCASCPDWLRRDGTVITLTERGRRDLLGLAETDEERSPEGKTDDDA